ncbi:Pex19 protein family-domain-containing protein [Phaeosphaeria sp. MPI-PUGE-AT-0046c]|nr:Pex19 protein family-domain-containing protein [Phaeosphaeria sp. MPI-PUGE-AT-0046c]
MADVPVNTAEQEPAKATPVAPVPPPAEVASDPEEDDLSDLDDVLDEFANTKIDSKAQAAPASKPKDATSSAPSASGPGRPEDVSPAELLIEDEDAFAKQLQKEMEQLLGQGDFGKQFEDIMKEMSQEIGANPLAADPPPATGSGKAKQEASPESAAKAEKNFQDTIKKTMERMQNSGDAAGAAAASSSQDDMLAQMLAAMGEGGMGGEGNDEDFSKILMGMMEQLTNREILYEPMKELNDKFPKWMEENSTKVAADDLKRYQEQQIMVKEITERFERKGYSDDNAGDREYIVERMQKMQAAGSPPPDLVGDMNAAQEVLQDMDQGCPTQ